MVHITTVLAGHNMVHVRAYLFAVRGTGTSSCERRDSLRALMIGAVHEVPNVPIVRCWILVWGQFVK
jgi:hypothetical protein